MNRIEKKLESLGIPPESELGLKLIKLDEVYKNIDDTSKHIKFLLDKKQQLIEDAEVMELLLMHKFNKDTRMMKWLNNGI